MALFDQNHGSTHNGTVALRQRNIHWSKKDFSYQKNFILKVFDGVYQKLGWEVLDYIPNEDIVFSIIDQIKQLVLYMTVQDVKEQERQEWLDATSNEEPLKCGFPICSEHNMLLTLFGCHACNN